MSHFARAALVPLSALLLPAAALRAHDGKHGANGTSAAGGKVVTIGDSYSSGTGIHKNLADYEGGECCRDWKTIPGARYASAEGMTGINVACAGGELPDVHEQFDQLQADYTADAASGWDGSLILFTIGGNDLRTAQGESWPQLLQSCIMSFYGKCHEKSENQLVNFNQLQADLTQFYTKVAQGARKASIRVMGYPRLLQRGWHCIPVPGLAASAANWADSQVDTLNLRLGQAVAEVRSKVPGVDIEFVDVTNFITKGACSTGSNEVHGIVMAGGGLSPMSMHPSQRGYDKYYEAFGQSMRKSLPPPQPPRDSISIAEVKRILDGWDSDQTGKLCIGEVLSMGGDEASPAVSKKLRTLFREADKDQDELLSVEEFNAFLALIAGVDETL
jgi:hypothetical protein